MNEFPAKRASSEPLWPAIVAIQRLGPFLMAVAEHGGLKPVARDTAEQLDAVMEAFARAAERGCELGQLIIPYLSAHPVIEVELRALAKALETVSVTNSST